MKKPLCMVTILLCFLSFVSFAYAEPREEKELTVMVYMCGSNLESNGSSASIDMDEMLASGLNTQAVNLVVLTGGAKKEDWTTPSLHHLETSLFLKSNVFNREDAGRLGTNMGDAATLRNFIRTCVEQYPARNYALILWDHGEGPLGHLCLDECNNNDGLTLSELAGALEEAQLPGKLRWLGFDACLMSTAEVALTIAPYAEYMIASQETEPSSGWDYAFLKGIENDADGEATGKRIVDAYFSGKNADEYGITLSCVSLCAMSELIDGMNHFFGPIAQELDTASFASISELRTGSANFGKAVKSVSENGYDLVDLWDAGGKEAARN